MATNNRMKTMEEWDAILDKMDVDEKGMSQAIAV